MKDQVQASAGVEMLLIDINRFAPTLGICLFLWSVEALLDHLLLTAGPNHVFDHAQSDRGRLHVTFPLSEIPL